MGLTERHWFEDEEPELTERQLQDVVEERDIFYKQGYAKGYLDGAKEQEERIKNRDESLEKAREEIKWLRGMLKEQEPVKPVLDEQTGRLWLCGKCGSYVGFEDNDPHDPNEFDKYCRECGRPVLWEGR